ncbi:MAG: CBS domain-containing protein [Magnetococcales bacterium]|nr:CBS domain-containing protein [Magnetococcales bacterium]NGZ28228.1 CBS domain-containing protein [Magnetococcales bacterium]
MQTPDELVVKAKPFFLNYFNKLANDLNTLTAAPVSCSVGEIVLLRGKEELEPFFEMDRSMAYVKEDGQNLGDIHLLFNVETSIALTGLMMMMGEGIIKEQVKTRTYTEEIQEGFQEVANQVVGAMNELVERKLKGGHLHLSVTDHVEYGEFPKSLSPTITYLAVVVTIQVSNFTPQSAQWLLTQKLAEGLLGLKFPLTEAEMAAAGLEGGGGDGAAAAALAGGLLPGGSKPKTDSGIDLSAYANLGVNPNDFERRVDLDAYAGVGTDPSKAAKQKPPDLAAFAKLLPEEEGGGDVAAVASLGAGGSLSYSRNDNLPMPNEPGSVKAVMVEPPFSMKEEEKVIKAINAMRQDGYKYIGIDTTEGKLVRIITQSDLRQLMGPFFGTKAMTARDKAICTVPLSKINKEQSLIRIPITGTIQQAADLINEFDLRVLPVVSKAGVLRGYVTVHAVLKYYRNKRQG